MRARHHPACSSEDLFSNNPLCRLIVGTKRYGIPDPDYDDPGDVIVESKIVLSEVLPSAGAEISYVYDFGDNWRHLIALEEIVPALPDGEYPRVIDGARSCPPEDSGGTTGYANLLEVLLDPAHDEYEHMHMWAGETFNAEVLSVKDINRRLRRNPSLSAKV